jgi:hypothetical protein
LRAASSGSEKGRQRQCHSADRQVSAKEAVERISYTDSRQRGTLFPEKIPEPRQLDDMFGRQNRDNEIRLRRGVNLIQMTLRWAQSHNRRMQSSKVPSLIR